MFSVDTKYSQNAGAAKSVIAYAIHAGTRSSTRTRSPPTELARVPSDQRLPTDLAHIYPVLFPPKVQLMDANGTTTAGDFCGYHRAFGSGSQTVYTVERSSSSSD